MNSVVVTRTDYKVQDEGCVPVSGPPPTRWQQVMEDGEIPARVGYGNVLEQAVTATSYISPFAFTSLLDQVGRQPWDLVTIVLRRWGM